MKQLHRLTLHQINENPTLMSDEVFVPAEQVDELIAALKAQHEAIDYLFALLITKTQPGEKPFYPSESGQPWDAIQFGKKAIEAAGG